MDTDKEKNIFYLEELSDYEVADSDKDVRGWEVKDKDGRVVGEVDNMLVNKNTERVVYLDIEVDPSIIEANHKPYNIREKGGVHGFLNEDGENHLILPIGLAHLNLDSKIVSTDNINHDTFAETKRIKKGAPIDRDYEVIILDSYVRSDEAKNYPKDDQFYDNAAFEQH